MSDTAGLLRELAQPWVGGEKTKEVINRAAKRAGLPYWRTFNIWYGKAHRIEAHEHDAVAAALEKKRLAEARSDYHELTIIMARLEARLSQIDPDFHRPSIDAARGQVRTLHGIRRTPDSSMD